MAWIAIGGAVVVKLQESSTVIVSGGSFVSWSATLAAKTVTVQFSLDAKSASGSSVKVIGPPLALAVCVPLREQEIENQLPVTSTASLKPTPMTASTGTPLAPLTGEREVTEGGWSPQKLRSASELRGAGLPSTKSAELSSVSVQPASTRRAAVVFERAGAGPGPS